MFDEDFMEFLCWVNRCLFPADLRDDLIAFGMPQADAYAFYYATLKERMEERGEIDILWLYQSYCLKDSPLKQYIVKYLEHQHKMWKTMEPPLLKEEENRGQSQH